MQILDTDWLELAKSLPIGRKVKVKHCGNSPSLMVSHNEKGYSAYCFRCEEKAFRGHLDKRYSAVQARKRLLEAQLKKKAQLPIDYTTEVPEHAAVWYLAYGISPLIASVYGIGYSAWYDRIILPVYSKTGELQCVQMRTPWEGETPKYKNISGENPKSHMFWGRTTGYDRVTVVTEDILSAIKVNEAARLLGIRACSILGSNLKEEQAVQIMGLDEKRPVILWFDSDNAGISGNRKAKRQLDLLGIPHTSIWTDEDPKCYTKDQIQTHIQAALNELARDDSI